MSQKLDVVRWTESFLDFLSRIFGSRNIPLAYVLRVTKNVDYDAHFELMNDAFCTEDSGCLEEELIKRVRHSNPLLKEDNGAVF